MPAQYTCPGGGSFTSSTLHTLVNCGCAQHGWSAGTIGAVCVDEDDDLTFKVAYDKGDHGEHVLDAGMYGWGPCAAWESWCLLVRVGDPNGQAPTACGGGFTRWAEAQLPDSAGEGEGGGGGLLSGWPRLRALAASWSRLPWSERSSWMATSDEEQQGTPEARTRQVRTRQARKQPSSKRGGVRGRTRDSDGVPAPALHESIKRKHRCKDGAMCRWCHGSGAFPAWRALPAGGVRGSVRSRGALTLSRARPLQAACAPASGARSLSSREWCAFPELPEWCAFPEPRVSPASGEPSLSGAHPELPEWCAFPERRASPASGVRSLEARSLSGVKRRAFPEWCVLPERRASPASGGACSVSGVRPLLAATGVHSPNGVRSWVAWQATVGLRSVGSREAGCPASCCGGRCACGVRI